MSGNRTSRAGLITLTVVLLLMLGGPKPAWADAAPPERPPGSSVGPGEAVTQVQMVSEEVLLVIEGRDTPEEELGELAADLMTGHVEAVFVMRNQGEAEESFDVWFPLGVPDGYGEVTKVKDFQAWADGEPAQVSEAGREGKWDFIVPWATWPATFPPGQDVVLRVTYDVLANGYRPYGTFPYMLETGAGWWGPIGEGTITFRLPYEVNETNTVLGPDVYDGPQVDWLSPDPRNYVVSGTDVVWRFSDLEPTAEHNVQLTVLAPSVWGEIIAAREEAEANPDQVELQLRLARALNAALWFRYGLSPIGNSIALAEEAEAAYLRALELASEDIEIYVEYLRWLQLFPEPGLPVLPENMLPTLERALALAPDDERLLDMQEWTAQLAPRSPRPTPPAVTLVSPTATPPPSATPTPTLTSTPAATPTKRATPSATKTPLPTETAPPPPSATALPTQEPESAGGGGICPGAVAMALVPLGILMSKSRRK